VRLSIQCRTSHTQGHVCLDDRVSIVRLSFFSPLAMKALLSYTHTHPYTLTMQRLVCPGWFSICRSCVGRREREMLTYDANENGTEVRKSWAEQTVGTVMQRQKARVRDCMCVFASRSALSFSLIRSSVPPEYSSLSLMAHSSSPLIPISVIY